MPALVDAPRTVAQLEHLLYQAHSLALVLGRERQAELVAQALCYVPPLPRQFDDWRP